LRAVLADETAYDRVEFADSDDLPDTFHELNIRTCG
ncbi:UDP-3-O-[3-hydroxymyristoyl] N-acetylglucosamine deacetylase, partial [Neisseria meningitidis]